MIQCDCAERTGIEINSYQLFEGGVYYPKDQENEMDINKPIENPVLVELLDNLKTQFNADTEHKFFKELLSAKFLSPITQGFGAFITTFWKKCC